MLDKKQIYLDINSSAPLHPNVKKALRQLLTEDLLPNPSSIHRHGRWSKKLISESREKIAYSLGDHLDPEQILFTSSGTEANQQIIKSVFEKHPNSHWITSPVEHHSVLEMIEPLEKMGIDVDLCEIDENGAPILESIESLIRENTRLVSLVWVNNETGVCTNVKQISNLLNAKKIPLHLDGAQAWGKIDLELDKIKPSFLSLSAHKIGAPSGVGAIYHAPGFPLSALIYGNQEKARRGGTENVLGIYAMAVAAESISLEKSDQIRLLRDALEQKVSQIPGIRINAKKAKRVAGTSNLTVSGIQGDSLVMALDLEGFSVSAGSACSSGVLEPSHVLIAMGLSKEEAQSSIRLSIDSTIDWENLEEFGKSLSQVVHRMRGKKDIEQAVSEKP